MKIIHIGILIGLFTFSACEIEESEEDVPKCPTVAHAPKEFLDYWFFPKGSWWVYKLKGSDPAIYDTVTITGRHQAFYLEPLDKPGPIPTDICEMGYFYDLAHSNSDFLPHFVPGQAGIETLIGLRDHSGNSWKFGGIYMSFEYPFKVEEGIEFGCAYDTSIVELPNFNLDKSVSVSCKIFDPEINDFITCKVSLTKGIGISYRRLASGAEWELINFQVKK